MDDHERYELILEKLNKLEKSKKVDIFKIIGTLALIFGAFLYMISVENKPIIQRQQILEKKFDEFYIGIKRDLNIFNMKFDIVEARIKTQPELVRTLRKRYIKETKIEAENAN